MLLYKPYHVHPILAGLKTETRRFWKKPRARVGATHKAKTQMMSKDYFALIYITGVRQERLGNIGMLGAWAEGGYTLPEYRVLWKEINGPGSWDPDREVWVVRFELELNNLSSEAWGVYQEIHKAHMLWMKAAVVA